MEELEITQSNPGAYSDDAVVTLDWKEHIRLRPGMYIGKLGDGSSQDDGIYVLIKEIIDNAIDEFVMGNGRTIEVAIKEQRVTIRDYGRGIPLGKVIDCVSKINTGAKYDSKVFKKAVGLNGVGSKAVNALSSSFSAQSIREGKTKIVEFGRGEIISDLPEEPSNLRSGTIISFVPDEKVFGHYHFISEYIEQMLWNYVFLNNGLTIWYNGTRMQAKNGLLDLLQRNINGNPLVYPIIQIKDEDFECAFTHSGRQYGEEYYSFVNGQHTTQGGTHQAAFREALVKTIRDFYKKDFEPSDIRQCMVAAISIKVQEPVFESQTKTKLGSQLMEPDGQSIRNYIGDILKKQLDNYLHMNSDVAEALLRRIMQSEKERKDFANIKKLAKESVKKVSLHNKKLRDCRIHYNSNDNRRLETTLFITEGDSASGSITKSRDVNTQAVFSLKGKPLNCYGLTKRVVYENDEFNLLQSALNIEEGVENLRYNYIVIATDADVDGMHIRLLMLTFFLQFYPDVVKSGHLYILQTPLFRVRNKKKTIYCYTDEERVSAIAELGPNPEITRFKGLGEISPEEFKNFIGPNMRLDPIILRKLSEIPELLSFYMGRNTPDRQVFIMDNLRMEEDLVNAEA
ncbi:DNA topoisomerase IV subunit B [Lentimicrobium sp.]|uniref:DNA topoisomerase IV subunit B n=1 Tax=Lentimicrobium sp. TaxID=2034841 RepID=UPI002601240C|nr:DNA topoisomerase IV subunit B [Lentimicrobium sp.]MCO5256630.1 type IIA DNA topoisomerase subunit B [Lentimicrobium sp.]HPF64523.1 DNA topoisomerase IV subunit B [Lentimicrobium sp.]HPJ62276.1 DNA topoisomerase IV subunit B [Lentimicrobium sp.]HPR25831.1 DNA topoisomerase IV subunit B [Lentimicrobium sp.]HRW69255.1 DNA topoisomerase IV subunit B [Lentimicrobium sp.]